MATLTNVNLNARSMNGISVINADEIYGNTINSNGTITINGNSLSTIYMDLSSNQISNNAKKTFYLNYTTPTLTNQYMRDFSNNGFAVPPLRGQTTMINQVGAYNLTYSGWSFVSGTSATRSNIVEWWYGANNGDIYWIQTNTLGGPPPLNQPSTFTGNYAIRFTTNAPTQTFYTQNSINLTEGNYVATFYSYWGASNYGGGYIGSTSASITCSIQNSTYTYKYSDPETRTNETWKKHQFFFQIPIGNTSTYIRWTPNETLSATYVFRWALAGLSIIKYEGQQFQDSTGTTQIGGSLSYIENPYLNNPVALNSLTCQGTPQFNLTTGASNLVLNTAFNSSNNNISNIAIGYGMTTGTTYTNNILIGHQNGGGATLAECVEIGTGIQNAWLQDVMIGNYLKTSNATTGYLGQNVVIGNFIGRDSGSTRSPTTGVSQRCVAIGAEQYSRYNGFARLPLQPTESVSIGFRSQYQNWDNYNTSVGCYSLNTLDGNNNGDDGFGFPHITQYNSAFGYKSGFNPRNATNCTFVGSFADISGNTTETTAFTNSTALGYGAKVRGDFSTAIGSNVFCDIPNCVKIGRSNDLVKIDGSLNVVGTLTLPSSSISDSALSSNIPLKNGTNVFTNSNTFNTPIRNGSSMPLKGCTYLNNTTTTTYVLSTSNWTENYVLIPTTAYSTEMYNITLPVITANMVGAHIIMSYQPYNITTTLTQYTTIQCSVPSGMYFPEIQSNNTFNTIQTFWSPGPAGQTNPVYFTIYFTAVQNDIGSYIWVATHSNYLKMMNNTWAYPQTFTSGITSNGVITSTAGITASATQTINFGTNTISMGSCQATGVNIGTSSQTISGGITFPNTDLYRKLVLYPITDNNFQNYSIGANNTNNEMMFLVPSNTRSFKFGYATSATAKTDVLTIDQNGITTASVKNVGAALTLSTTTSGDINLSPAGPSVNINKKLVMNDVAAMTGGTGLVFAGGFLNGQVYYASSVRAVKTNIIEIPDDDPVYNLETFMKIKPSLFNPKEGHGNTKQRCIGFIAEEINELGLKELNSFKNPEMTELAGVHYDYFSAYLVKAVQLQQKIINKQQQQIDDLISILKSKNII